jgi:hypothetical protein
METKEKITEVITKLAHEVEYEKWLLDPISYLKQHEIAIDGLNKLSDEQQEQVESALREIQIPKQEGLTGIRCSWCKGLIIASCAAVIVGTIVVVIASDGLAVAAEDVAVEGAVDVVADATGLSASDVWTIIERAWSKTGPVQFLGVLVAMLCEAMGDC